MRRLAPFFLLGVLVAGTGLGIGLGLANQSTQVEAASAFLHHVLAATRDTGSAHFTYSSTTRSTNPLLRATSTGSGAVSFKAGAVEVKVTSHSRGLTNAASGGLRQRTEVVVDREVHIGKNGYLRLSSLTQPLPGPLQSPWVKMPSATRSGMLGGVTQTLVGDAFGAITSPFRDLVVKIAGYPTIGSGATTEYSVRAANCSATNAGSGVTQSRLSTTLWVDSQGRLVLVESTFHFATSAQPEPKVGEELAGTATTVARLRFEDFGVPVKVIAPVIQRVAHVSVAQLAVRAC